MRFFLDNMISARFARALREVQRDVVALREVFPEDAPDEDWIARIAEHRCVLVTLDRHIRSRPLQRQALARARVIALFLGPFFSRSKFWDQFVWLVRYWTRIEHTVAGLERGACMAVRQNGRMQAMPRV
ncbi:MAG TPA: DUF5615 family PIN-like protein [Phycisphaerae bacterium]|nr:DUF5615 family PIN-like protein [Phycisphaerae bacterium]